MPQQMGAAHRTPFPPRPYLTQGDANDPKAWQSGTPVPVSATLNKNLAGADWFTLGSQKFCAFDGLDFVCK